ncbi:MAG: biopolymer transporter ExbD [Planctomycetota bacterium]
MRRRGRASAPRLEMVPMIDVMFLLLTVFIYSMLTMVRAYVIPVELPTASTGEESELTAVLVVSVERDGRLTVGGEPIDLAGLTESVAARRDATPDLQVLVNADAATAHGTVVRVFDRIRAAGQNRVLIVGRPDDGG